MLLPARVQSGSPASAAVISSSLSKSTRPPYSRRYGHAGGRGADPDSLAAPATSGQDRQRPAGSSSQMMTPGEAQPAQVDDNTGDYALIAIQGPHAGPILQPLTDIGLDQVRYYAGQPAVVAGREVLLARTGYTGEDGFELFTSPTDAEPVWMALSGAGEADGLVPAGLAARDTLRLEAGMPLYGNELGADVTPFDAGLGRVVVFDKPGDFVGRAALAE